MRDQIRIIAAAALALLLVVTGLSLPPRAFAQVNNESASITLGDVPVENGITARPGDDATGLLTGTQDNRGYWQTNKTDGSRIIYFYMNVDDTYLYDSADYDVEVSVDYFDQGSGSIVLQYDSQTAGYKDAPLFNYTNTGTWKTHTFKVTDAKFANRTGGGDFRVGIEGGGASWQTNADLKLASASVKKTLKGASSDSASIVLGDPSVESGITARAGDNESGLIKGEAAGKSYWRTNSAAPGDRTLYLYMNVDDGYLFDNSTQDVYVSVEYLDQGSGTIVLQYDAQGDNMGFKDAPAYTYGDSGQWKSYTFKLSDAKFANRTNGADFRIGISGNGAPANNPDMSVHAVTVTKAKRVGAPANAKVYATVYPTSDVVIADYNARDFGALGDGATDDTESLQLAIDAAGNNGGGVVFLPDGIYRVNGNLIIPTGVTLRGDWANPESQVGAVRGTVLASYGGRGNENGESFIRMQPVSGVTNLSIWYPEQSAASPVAYPWTIEQLSGDSATVKNVTLVNAYNGIKIGPVWNELHYVNNLYGTALKTGIFLDFTTDIGRLERIHLAPGYWANSGLPGAPDAASLHAYMTENAEGIVMGRSDWEYMSDISISGFKTGMRITTRTGSLETANAQLYRVNIEDCNVALKIEGVNDFGLLVSDSSFKASVGDAPKAIYATQGFHSIVQFNKVTVGGAPLHAVLSEGSGVLSFENSMFENWNEQQGGYALAAEGGSIILGQSTFAKADHHLLLTGGVAEVRSLNSGHNGQLKVDDQSDGAELNIHQDARYTMKPLPSAVSTDLAVAPKPAIGELFDLTKAPYNADKSGGVDVSGLLQSALDAASAAGGGTVYLPAGIYRVEQPISVPSGVELRGSWDVAHHTIGGGTVIFTNHGENDADGEPLIALEASAGVRGLSVYYDQQSWDTVKPYAWTIQGRGHGVYAIDTTLINSYLGLDFASYDTSGHYIDYVAGSPLKEGIVIGGGASDGIVRNVQFNPHYYGRNNYPNHPSTDADFQKVWDYQKEHLDAFRVGDVSGETIFNTFVYGSQYGIHFEKQNGNGPEAVIIGHGTDGSKKGVYLEGAGADGLSFVNTELVSLSTTDKVYITTAPSFDGEATFFNSSMWGDTTRSIDAYAGKLNIQQANFTNVGERGVNALGGDVDLYNSYFQQAGTTHVSAGSDIERLNVSNNVFKGGMQLANEAADKVVGTNLVPVTLQLVKGTFDEAHPAESNLKLSVTNATDPQPVGGRIEWVQPASYAGTMAPIRFEQLGHGQSVTVPLPYLAADALKFKVVLDSGYSYMTSVKTKQSFASKRGSAADAPAITLNAADQYFSLGGKWNGVDDLSLQSNVTWDDDNLYIAIDVHDDHHAQSWTGGDIWQGDSIQLALDLSRQAGAGSANVSELGFALSNTGTVTQWRWRAPSGLAAGNIAGAHTSIVRDDASGVTTYAITLPWTELHGPGVSFDPTKPIGFTLLANENDGAGRAAFMEYNQGIGTSKDSVAFGDLYLLSGSYTALLESSATAAVNAAVQSLAKTQLDAARSFVSLLPAGTLKQSLATQLDAAGSGGPSGPVDPTGPTGPTGPSGPSTPDTSSGLNVTPVVDSATGIAKAVLDAKSLDQAIGKAEPGKDGVRRITVNVFAAAGATGYAVELPTQAIAEAKGKGKGAAITLVTPLGSVELPSDLLAGKKDLGSTVVWTVQPAKGLSATVSGAAGGRPAIELSLQSQGKPVAGGFSSAVTVALPYKATEAELAHSERLVVWRIDGQGHATPIPSSRYDSKTGQMTFKTAQSGTFVVVYATKTFADLARVPWAKQAIEALSARGIVQGANDNEFQPSASIKRADFVLLLVRALELSAPFDGSFSDVPRSAYYYDALGIARELGIATGNGNGTFDPNARITREEAAVLLARALKAKQAELAAGSNASLSDYADGASVSAYAVQAMASLLDAGLLQGSGGKLNPAGALTRAEAAVLLYRAIR
nr:S-layer homology domain-containing protein [Paenibacillus sp. MMS18-CY102]